MKPRWPASSCARAAATANTSPPPPSCSCASSASRPAMPSAMRCTKPPAGNTSCASAMPMPGAWCGTQTSATWQDFDTTPASWVAAEASRASPMQFLSDCWSRVVFEFAKFRWGQTHLRQYFLWALAPVLALLLYQIIFRSRRRRHAPKPARRRAQPSLWPGTGLGILSNRKEAGRARRAAPTERAAFRLAAARQQPTRRWRSCASRLRELLRLHYRYRFDPQGLSQTDREALRREATGCLARLA